MNIILLLSGYFMISLWLPETFSNLLSWFFNQACELGRFSSTKVLLYLNLKLVGFFEWKLSRDQLLLLLWPFEQKESPFSSYPKGGFHLSHNFHIRTQINLTRVNKIIETLHGKICVNGRVERRSTFMCLCRTFHTLPLILFTHIPESTQKKYVIVEIHLNNSVNFFE